MTILTLEQIEATLSDIKTAAKEDQDLALFNLAKLVGRIANDAYGPITIRPMVAPPDPVDLHTLSTEALSKLSPQYDNITGYTGKLEIPGTKIPNLNFWVGCGECDPAFACYDSKFQCVRYSVRTAQPAPVPTAPRPAAPQRQGVAHTPNDAKHLTVVLHITLEKPVADPAARTRIAEKAAARAYTMDNVTLVEIL